MRACLRYLFIVRAAEEVVQRNWIPVGTGHGADLVVAGVLAASVAVGLGVDRWVERPLVHHARSRVNLFYFRHPEASLKRSAANGGRTRRSHPEPPDTYGPAGSC